LKDAPILVLDQGRLVEHGRFDELIRQRSLFARLAEDDKFAPDARTEISTGVKTAESLAQMD
jgi:ATP-binding cassette subfamily B protein